MRVPPSIGGTLDLRNLFHLLTTQDTRNASPNVWAAGNDGGVRVYHHLLQRAILEALLMPEVGWGTKVELFAHFGSTFEMKKGETISGDQITHEFARNIFIVTPFLALHAEGAALTVPPGTRISGTVPDDKVAANRTGQIRLSSRFFDLTIETRMLMRRAVLGGRYALLTGRSWEDPRYGDASYAIRVTATASRVYAHHPEMPKYLAWMQTITDYLARAFDEEERWKVIMENHTLRHTLASR
jgi:hypothetical protein